MTEITRKTRVMAIVGDEELRRVLDWYGLPTNDRAMLRLTLEDYCMEHDVDVEDLIVELAVLEIDGNGDDDDDNDWLFTD